MDKSAALQSVLPSMEDCRLEAGKLRAAHPQRSATSLAELAARNSRSKGVTFHGSAPFVDSMGLLKIEARLAGVIAAVLAPDDVDVASFHADILAIVFPLAVEAALRDLGIDASQRTTKVLVRKHVDLAKVVHFAAKLLGVSPQMLLTSMPLAWNWSSVRTTGRRAVSYHQNRAA